MTEPEALAAWLEMKQVLRRRLGKQQWELWLKEARLLWFLGGRFMLIALPRSGRKIYAAQGHKRTLQRLAAKRDLSLSYTVYPDEYDWMRLQERGADRERLKFLEPETV
ncbi:MAG TPA: hypothetical protein VJN64_15180, partial [Terriglobales bacterium]|nr:hypothetical protein [Terriglobales bacterium]